VDLAFYEELVAICRHYQIYAISDLAYNELYFDGKPTPSILEVKGAKDVAIEFTTISKSYSMAGWRIGFACGNKELVGALTKIKSYLDYGTFLPVQVGATAALNGPQDYVQTMRDLYQSRRDVMVAGLKDAGWDVPVPSASMFIWAPLPEKYKHMSCMEFSKKLIEGAGVAVAPGIGFGPGGEGYVRIALVENKNRIRQAVRNIKQLFMDESVGGKKKKESA
jgi:alanine-synthesizing transaminase